MTSPRPDPGDRAELHRPGGHGPEAPQRHDAPSAEAPHGGVADDLPDPHEVLGKRNRLLLDTRDRSARAQDTPGPPGRSRLHIPGGVRPAHLEPVGAERQARKRLRRDARLPAAGIDPAFDVPA